MNWKASEQRRIGATLRLVCEMRGLKVHRLATDMGISPAYLSNILAGRRPLTEALLTKAADALCIEPVAIVREGYFDRAAAEEEKAARRRLREAEQLAALVADTQARLTTLATETTAALAAGRKAVAA